MKKYVPTVLLSLMFICSNLAVGDTVSDYIAEFSEQAKQRCPKLKQFLQNNAVLVSYFVTTNGDKITATAYLENGKYLAVERLIAGVVSQGAHGVMTPQKDMAVLMKDLGADCTLDELTVITGVEKHFVRRPRDKASLLMWYGTLVGIFMDDRLK